MDDEQILRRINEMSEEEERLYLEGSAGGGLSEQERDRLEQLRIGLDRAYDLLRQRQARRNAGLDPDEAEIRPPKIVEGYEQ